MTSTASAFVVRAPQYHSVPPRKPMMLFEQSTNTAVKVDVSILDDTTIPFVDIQEPLIVKEKSLRATLVRFVEYRVIVIVVFVSAILTCTNTECRQHCFRDTIGTSTDCRSSWLFVSRIGKYTRIISQDAGNGCRCCGARDVFLLKCNTLVVFHGSGSDATPGLLQDYCVGRHESILEFTFQELSEIVVFNENYPEFACHATKIRNGVIPTLNQVLEDFKDSSFIIKIELKGAGTAEPVLQLVEEYGMQHQCHYSSFDLDQIATIRALRPQLDQHGKHIYKTGALFSDVSDNYIQLAQQVGASEVHLKYDECTVERVLEIHAAGMDSMAWFRGPIGMKSDVTLKYWDVGNEEWSMYQAVMQTGVKQMCVNRPDVLINMF